MNRIGLELLLLYIAGQLTHFAYRFLKPASSFTYRNR